MDLGIKTMTLKFDDNQLGHLAPIQGDTKSRGFVIEMVSADGEIVPADSVHECRLYGVNSNYPDKTFYTKAEVVDGKYKVYLSTDMVSKAGTLKIQIALYKGAEELIQSEVKEVEVSESMANGGNLGKDLVVDFTKLEKALERVDTQEKAYKDNLQKQEVIKSDIDKKQRQVSTDTTAVKKIRTDMEGVMAAEADRVSAEKTRQSQESTRQRQEGIRESKFKEAETNRSKIFKEKENLRQSEETKRQSQENTRQSQENTRQSQETQRVEAEKKRVSAENARANAEKDRQSQESTRETNEDKRKSNESARVTTERGRQYQETRRQSQETARVEAEKKRKSTFDGWDKTMQGVIPNATQTTAGVVRVLPSDKDGETGPYTVPTMNVFEENLIYLGNELSTKADKSHNHKLTKLEEFDKLASELSRMEKEYQSIDTNVSEQLQVFGDSVVEMIDNKADKSHVHRDKHIILESTGDTLENELTVIHTTLDLHNDNITDLEDKKISFTGQIPFKNAQIIEKGASTSGIPNETMIYELE